SLCHLFFYGTAPSAICTLSLHDALPIYLPLGAAACCVHRGRVWVEPALCESPSPHAWQGEAELPWSKGRVYFAHAVGAGCSLARSEEHTSELQSRENLVCRLLLEKKKKK